MVGIVIVSHSEKIALGIAELCNQMTQGNVSIEAAGGTTDGRIGTDAMKIMEAIQRADTGDGVVVLMDLGSAVMSTELALDLLEDKLRERVVLVDAPIVEGSISAAVQASIGSMLEEVKLGALESKGMVKL
ncbi:dihydroxyacetone kinase phosphoryl donor subunit DhaM [Alkaliphilus crotonatoxidans]